MKKIFGFVCFVGVTLAFSLEAIVIRDDRLDVDALTAGAAFESVGLIGTPSSYWWGSGTLIDPEWMVTAGHCLYDGLGNKEEELWVNLGGVSVQADRWFAHESYDDVGEWDDWDIALIHLSSPVDWVSVSPLYTGSLSHGTLLSLVGYGGYGDGLTGYVGYDDRLRAAQNVVDAFGGEDISFEIEGETGNCSAFSPHQFLIDFDDPSQGDGPFGGSALDFEGNTAPGDSGGGWFIEVDGTNYLTGIVSGGYLDNAGYGDISFNTDITYFNDWIARAIPEPSTVGVFVVGLFVFLIRNGVRRSRRC